MIYKVLPTYILISSQNGTLSDPVNLTTYRKYLGSVYLEHKGTFFFAIMKITLNKVDKVSELSDAYLFELFPSP